jgi:UPF0755 protein
MKKYVISVLGIIAVLILTVAYFLFIQKVDSQAEKGRFVVPLSGATSTAELLVKGGFVKSEWPFMTARILRGVGLVRPGGYAISKSMTAWQIAGVLKNDPYMEWIVLKEGLRKEQIGEILVKILGWSEEQYDQFISVSTAPDKEHVEGVYFPDTYLIPLTETPDEVALRMRRRFDEVFAPLAKEAISKNIKWTTAVTIASLIQREAGGKDDMALISGVIWNRLEKGMKLDIDATLQYITGNKEDGWWGKVSAEDKKIDSPFNTYISKTLPPHPIANPGLNALRAAINPETTDCFYYLHTPDKKIYCAVTFEEHKQNIEKYLKK